MRERGLIVVDWTNSAARVAVIVLSLRGFELRSEFTIPTRTAVRHEHSGTIRNLVGADAVGIQQDESTIVFEQPGRALPIIEDPDLQTELLKGFWHTLHQALAQKGIIGEGQAAAVYVIPPLRFPPSLLESFRAVCANETPLLLGGFTNAAAALVLGCLRLDAANEVLAKHGSEQITVCLAVASNSTVDIACFDYALAEPKQHIILIRDFFQTTGEDLSSRLHDCDWLGAFTLLLLIEDPGLTDLAKARITVPLEAIADRVQIRLWQSSAASRLKLSGCAQIARFVGGATDGEQYELTHACNLGVQIDGSRFHPIVSKESWSRFVEFPNYSAQPFILSSEPASALRLNFCCGYSTRVADATPLGYAVLSHSDLGAVKKATSLTAAIRLDTRGSGEFLLGLMPENRVLRRQPFVLPGLV
ncbi:MAG: hypothetical protein AABN95_07500 [Acidobacteriota bacterium]